MPPHKRTGESETPPRVRPGPPKKQVAAAVEKSAEYLEEQNAPPSDVHPKPTTPSKAAVEEAVEQSSEFLRSQGVTPDVAATETRNKGVDAAPVSAGGSNPGLDAAPIYAGRDKTADASPVFSAPVRDKPAED